MSHTSKLTTDVFEPQVGSELIVHLDDGAQFPLTLIKVTALGKPQSAEDQSGTTGHSAFTLDLKGPLTPVLPSLTYPVSALDTPATHLFISAHAQDDIATYYNIVVN